MQATPRVAYAMAKLGSSSTARFKMWDGGLVVCLQVFGLPQTEGLQGFQRGSGRLLQRRRELLHRSQGFAHLLTKVGGGFVQSFQYLLFAVNFDLLASQRIAGCAIQCRQGDDVMISQAGDAAREHGLDALALADFAGNVVGQPFVRGLAHQTQGFADLGFGNDVQVGRLLQLHSQGLFEGSVEYRIAGGVDEVGEQDAVFLSQLGGALGS